MMTCAARGRKKRPLQERARIPVKEVSHELRPQSIGIARRRQRIDFDILIVRLAMNLRTGTHSPSAQKKRRPACARNAAFRFASTRSAPDHGS
jgi:hypothetical protein